LGFYVFSAGCVAHGGTIRERRRIGNALSQNLSKTENWARKTGYNYAGLFMIFGEGREVCIAMCVCKDQAGTSGRGPLIHPPPETENFPCQSFHAARLKPMEAVAVTPESHTTVTQILCVLTGLWRYGQ
ncbi:MAG: hypothetical protein LBO77_00290, partial [Desulfovibrio sp.]|jgi:hypothetical protein|nr:hypothetical protein [Desulfovibrio sp.]